MFRFGSVALRHVIKELRGTTYNEIEIKNRQKQKNTPQQRDCQAAETVAWTLGRQAEENSWNIGAEGQAEVLA